MAVKVSGESLQLIHRIHQQLTDLRSRLARGPHKTSAANSKVDVQQTLIDDYKNSLKKTKLLADRKQLQLNEGEGKVE